MDSSKIRQAIFDLFPEDRALLHEADAEVVLQKMQPLFEELYTTLDEQFSSIQDVLDDTTESEATTARIDDANKQIEEIKTILNALDKAIGQTGVAAKKGADSVKTELVAALQGMAKNHLSLVEVERLNRDGLGVAIRGELGSLKQGTDKTVKEVNKAITDLKKQLKKEIADVLSKLATSIGKGGGNMNRNISIGGNASTLSRYTDINLKAGTNVTITYANNNTTKNTDITIAATGGGGTGITRSVNAISTSQTAGATAGTDYVYVASAGVAVTLPTAVGNTNLYTVKNTAASSVLILPNGAETIDAQGTIILATQYTAIDLISDGSNWGIT